MSCLQLPELSADTQSLLQNISERKTLKSYQILKMNLHRTANQPPAQAVCFAGSLATVSTSLKANLDPCGN